MKQRLLEFHGKFETFIVGVLLALMMVVVLAATAEFMFLLADALMEHFRGIGSVEFMRSRMHVVFAGFLVIILGIELMETIRMYLIDRVVHVEVVFLVAMIAVGRHVIELDYLRSDSGILFGVAAIILALAAGYFLVSRSPARPTEKRNDTHE